MNKFTSYEWIKEVINSCVVEEQVILCNNLINNHKRMFNDEDSETLIKSLRNCYIIKLKTINKKQNNESNRIRFTE